MRNRYLLALAAGVSLVAACEGFKQALTAHVDVVARAGSQELSVTRLGDLLGNAKLPIPTTKDNAAIIADLWVNYQLMAHAAATSDSLADKKAIDAAVAPLANNMILRRYVDSLTKAFNIDSTKAEAAYNSGAGNLYAARHILFGFPQNATSQQMDSVHAVALKIRPQVTDANFAAMVAKYSTEPGAAQRGGSLDIFPKEQMVTPFSNAVAALKPGEISQPVMTQFGWHIIERMPYAAVKDRYVPRYLQLGTQAAESTYLVKLESDEAIQVKSGAVAATKAAALDLSGHASDKSVLATYKTGELTTGQLVTWLQGFPPNANIARELQTAPDTMVSQFLRSIARNQVLLERAHAAHVDLSPDERNGIYHDFGQMVQSVWQSLGVSPAMLADSAKTQAERDRLAASRVEAFLDRIMAGESQPVPVPGPLANLLRAKYEWSINPAGIDRAVQNAQVARTKADSARAMNRPPSAVPLPMGPTQRPATPPQQH